MRTIETTLYQYSELNEQAKQYAIKALRQRCFEANAEWTWDDANATIKTVEETAGVRCDINESSQGFYVNNAFRRGDVHYDLSDKDEFEVFRKNYIEQYKEMLWCDQIMLKIVKEWEFDERRSYAGNVDWMIVKFCEKINDDCMCYFDDDAVEEWIEGQDFEFTEDGRLYNQ